MPEQTQSLHQSIETLLLAMQQQVQAHLQLTAAINRLAASNGMLVQAMAEGEGVDDQRIPSVGLNGRPL